MEKHMQYLSEAIKSMKIADHIIYITYPTIKDKRLLLKALDSVHESVAKTVNSILQYDYLWKRIQLYREPRQNFEIFKSKCSKRLNLSPDDLSILIELFSLIELHRKSSMEFSRQNKIVIMSDNLKTSVLDLEKAKNYLNLSKKLIERATRYMGPS
jgi:hypothetical protein